MQKALQYLERQILVPGLHIRKTVVFGFTFHKNKSLLVAYFSHTFHHYFYILKCAYFE